MTAAIPNISDASRLLIVKMSSIGDILHAIPAVHAIKARYGSVWVGWVVRHRCHDILIGNPDIDRLYVIPDRPNLLNLLHLRNELHRDRYDVALDMQGLFLSGVVAWLSGARQRVGWNRNRELNAIWMTDPIISGLDHDLHEIDALYGFAQALQANSIDRAFPTQDYLAKDEGGLIDLWFNGLTPPIIAINVGASRAYKRWSERSWVRLCTDLINSKCSLVFVGDTRDGDIVNRIVSQLSNPQSVVNLAGKTTLRSLGSVFAKCDVAISGDSGPMHLAVAVGTPTIGLFGATNPYRHGPYGPANTSIFKAHEDGKRQRRPSDSEGASAMAAISSEQVFSAALAKLAELKKCQEKSSSLT